MGDDGGMHFSGWRGHGAALISVVRGLNGVYLMYGEENSNAVSYFQWVRIIVVCVLMVVESNGELISVVGGI